MIRFCFLLMLFLCSGFAAQSEPLRYDDFGRLPILHEGRIKPLSSVAILNLKALRDGAIIDNDAAISFMAQSLFDPAEAADAQVIAVRNPHTRLTLGLDKQQKYFALTDLIEPLRARDAEVAQWLKMDPKELSEDQSDMLRLYDVAVGLTQVLRSFTAVLPLDSVLSDEVRQKYDLPSGTMSYLDLVDVEERINADLKALIKQKGDDVDAYKDDERALAYLSYQIQEIRTAGAGNNAMRVLPVSWDQSWYSPWDMLLLGQGSPESMKTLAAWRDIASAYRDQDRTRFTQAIGSLQKRMGFQPEVKSWRLALEQIYTALHPITLSLLLYLLAFIVMQASRAIWAHKILIAAVIVHGAAIVMRVIILERPPVSTLFESTLFVGFVAVLAALWSEQKLKNGIGIVLACIMGIGLQLTTLGFAQNGDTLHMLQAVLNTPFWLATHVIIIAMGYSLCLLVALLAHADLWLIGSGRDTKKIQKIMHLAALCALLLTAVGTILGGLWADQSWGRFWGWDPKENGALLIVLWLTWIMHGRLSGHIKPVAYSAGCAALAVIVAGAWFGVNLLSTGLHSYGFINGIAAILTTYVAVQSLVIIALWQRAHKAVNLHAS